MTLSEKAARKGSSMKKHRRTFFVIENFDGIKKIAEILEWKGTSAIFLYEIDFCSSIENQDERNGVHRRATIKLCYAICIIRNIKLLYFSNKDSSVSELYSRYSVGFCKECEVEVLMIRISSLSWMIYKWGPIPVS